MPASSQTQPIRVVPAPRDLRPLAAVAAGAFACGALAAGLAAHGGGRAPADAAARAPARLAAARVSALLDHHLRALRPLAKDPFLARQARRLNLGDAKPRVELPMEAAALRDFDARLSPSHLLEPDGEASAWLRRVQPLLGGATTVVLVEANGFAAAGSSPVHDVFTGGALWFRHAVRAGEAVSLPVPGSGIPVDTFCVAVGIPRPDGGGGAPAGVLFALYPVRLLAEALREDADRAFASSLVDPAGAVLAGGTGAVTDLASDPALARLAHADTPVPPLLARAGGQEAIERLGSGGPAARWLVAAPYRPSRLGPAVAAGAAGGLAAALAALAATALVRRDLRGRLASETAALCSYVELTGAGGRTVPPPSLAEIPDLGDRVTRALEGLRSSRADLERTCRTLEERLSARTAELARMSQELQRRTEEVAAASRGKEEFLTVMSHELRTPLNSIIGLTQLVRDGAADSPDEARAFLDQVLQSAGEQLRLINDVLEVARLESGKVELALASVPVGPVAEAAAETIRASAAAKGLEVRTSVAPDARTAWADRTRLLQVLASLADNAVKFTPAGAVEIRASASDGRRKILFEVEDTGVGIPEEKRATVFEKFIQAEAGVGRRFGGAGLGLPISRLLVEAMGGKIGIEARAGGSGTRVWFTVPVPGREGR